MTALWIKVLPRHVGYKGDIPASSRGFFLMNRELTRRFGFIGLDTHAKVWRLYIDLPTQHKSSQGFSTPERALLAANLWWDVHGPSQLALGGIPYALS